ncbi:MAG: hypothetical protein ACYCYO_01705 [Bacilli bacterium]
MPRTVMGVWERSQCVLMFVLIVTGFVTGFVTALWVVIMTIAWISSAIEWHYWLQFSVADAASAGSGRIITRGSGLVAYPYQTSAQAAARWIWNGDAQNLCLSRVFAHLSTRIAVHGQIVTVTASGNFMPAFLSGMEKMFPAFSWLRIPMQAVASQKILSP